MPLMNERGELVLPQPQSGNLILRRYEGDAVLIEFNGEQVLLVVDEIRKSNVQISIKARAHVQVSRVDMKRPPRV